PRTSPPHRPAPLPRPVSLPPPPGPYPYRGVDSTAGTWDGTTGTQIYHQVGYDHPVFLRFAANDIPTVTGLQWTCSYVNTGTETYTFGPFTDNNEHCNLFAFYYPTEGTHETITCVQQHGIVTTALSRCGRRVRTAAGRAAGRPGRAWPRGGRRRAAGRRRGPRDPRHDRRRARGGARPRCPAAAA